MVTTDSQPYDNAGGGTVAEQAAASTGSEKPRGFTLGDLTFRMYAKLDNIAGKNYGVGTYLGTVFLDAGFGIKMVDKGNGVTYIGVDDRQFFDDKNYGSVDYTDIQINVTMNGQYIKNIEFLDSDFKTGGSYSNIRFEVWLAGEVLSSDFVKDLGMIVGPDNRTGPSGSGGGSSGAPGTPGSVQAGSLNELAAIQSFDYALNKGSYLILDRWLGEVDPRAIFLLDYGKSVANYSNKSPDAWSLYFTAPEALWSANSLNTSFLKPGESWWNYTALRHFDMANVLFCDGHIETLSADALSETSPLWGVGAW
jgi:prepilin-type processing-associated H-X9-DG protein